MEVMLKKAAERMPVSGRTFADVTVSISGKAEPVVRKNRLQPLLIVLAAVVLLAGCATAYGAYAASRGTWNLYTSEVWTDAKLETGKYGISLPEEYDGHGFREMSVGSSVPDGVSYFEAIFSGYKSVHVTYGAEGSCYSVGVGSTTDEYWVTYFGYDSETLWSGDGDYLAVEYEGYTIHTGYYLGVYGNEARKATWVDPERKICVSVHGFGGHDPLPLAKLIIDGLKNGPDRL